MSAQNWKRVEYTTWDEAFRALSPINRQQSVRIAEYTQILFTAACSASYGKENDGGTAEMRGQYADVAYKCGLYHQLGKALVPPEYQVWQKAVSEEEIAVYRKYTTDGRLLVAQLQEKGLRAKEKRTGSLIEPPTRNVPWLMMRESCEQHMERYDGTGFPEGRSGLHISPIAHIVGLAKELDRLSAETKSEHPFDEAVKIINGHSGTAWDPELIAVFNKNIEKCRAVYEKFIHYTMTLPETIPLVVKSEKRPMGLHYRPVMDPLGYTVGYDAIPWFGGIANRPGETESGAELEEMLKRTGVLIDLYFYFLYEAGDTLLRLQNCEIDTKCVIVEMLPAFYKSGSQLQRFQKLFEDQPVPREKLMLTLPESILVGASKTTEELIIRYTRNGISLVVDGLHTGAVPYGHIAELGIKYVRLASEQYMKPETAEEIKQMRAAGLRVIGGDVSEREVQLWLSACGAEMMSGPLTGRLCDEDDIIRDGLARNL